MRDISLGLITAYFGSSKDQHAFGVLIFNPRAGLSAVGLEQARVHEPSFAD